MKRFDVVWVDFGEENKPSEQKGKRPAIVVSNDYINNSSPCIIVCPFTSRIKRTDLKFHVELEWISYSGSKTKKSVVLCEQVRTVSKTRISKTAGFISKENQIKVQDALKATLGL